MSIGWSLNRCRALECRSERPWKTAFETSMKLCFVTSKTILCIWVIRSTFAISTIGNRLLLHRYVDFSYFSQGHIKLWCTDSVILQAHVSLWLILGCRWEACNLDDSVHQPTFDLYTKYFYSKSHCTFCNLNTKMLQNFGFKLQKVK